MALFNDLLKALLSLLSPRPAEALPITPKPESQPAPLPPVKNTDWTDPTSKISKRFSVSDATKLPSWSTYHKTTDEQRKNILGIAEKVEKAIDLLEKELKKTLIVSVHAWIRPEVSNVDNPLWNGKDYNRYIYETQVWKGLTPEEKAKKKVPNSPHKSGHAIDFHIVGYEGKEKCAEIRKLLVPHLEKLGLRMEDIEGGWIHLDDLPVGINRFFKP